MYDPSPQAITVPKSVLSILTRAKEAIATPETWCQNNDETDAEDSPSGKRQVCAATAILEAAGYTPEWAEASPMARKAPMAKVASDAIHIFAAVTEYECGWPMGKSMPVDTIIKVNDMLDHKHLLMIFDAAIHVAGG